jgi:MYXO-CTERM domain-containing protein
LTSGAVHGSFHDAPAHNPGNAIVLNSLAVALPALLALAAVAVHRRRRAMRRAALDDAMIRAIEERGIVEVDEPLDLDHIAEEEQRFLNEERWDAADEW